MSEKQYKYVKRWVMTHINRQGDRQLSEPMQGRYTFRNEEEVQHRIASMIGNTSGDTLRQVYGEQALDTFEPREVDCYEGGHDPTTMWFDN